MEELETKLRNDIELLGIRSDYKLELVPFSKTRYGNYYPHLKKIRIYVYDSAECVRLYPYEQLLDTLIHECVHHIQWSEPSYTRYVGVMHDVKFINMYNYLTKKVRAIKLFKEVCSV